MSPEPAGKGGRPTNPHDRPSRKATHIYSQLNRILSGHEAKNRNRSKTRYKYHSNVEKMENIYTCDKIGKKEDVMVRFQSLRADNGDDLL